MQVVANTSINSLQRRLWRRYVSSRVSDAPEIALSKLKFLKDDRRGTQRATVGGVLLASEDPREWLPNAYVQAVCYDSGNMDANRQLDAQDIAGPLDEQIRGAMRFVIRNRRVAARKQPARTDFPQYSERAVFEAVVNAVVHRDYSVTGSRIRLFMFDDRLELYSPGGLCNSMKIEDLRTSQFTRNELLASRLGQCPVGGVTGSGGRQYFIERRGEGIGVIEDDTFAVAGTKARVRACRRAGTQTNDPRGRAAPARGSFRPGDGSARGYRRATTGCACPARLPEQDPSRRAHGRVWIRGLRASRQAAHDGAVRCSGVPRVRPARASG